MFSAYCIMGFKLIDQPSVFVINLTKQIYNSKVYISENKTHG